MASRLPTQDPRSFRDPHHNMRARIVGIRTFEAGNVGNNPPSNSNAPTPSAARVTPVCVPLTVDSIPQPGQFYPDDGQGPIDVNSLLFRLRETLCRNTCGTVAGVPADDMTFVSTADGKGCLIAEAIPGLKQVYMYRSVATLGRPMGSAVLAIWRTSSAHVCRMVLTRALSAVPTMANIMKAGFLD